MSIQRDRPADTVVTSQGGGTNSEIAVSRVSTRRVPLSASGAADPRQLARAYQELVNSMDKLAKSASNKYDAGAVIFKDVAFTAGQTVRLQHKLGRAYQDWMWTRPRGGTVDLQEVAATSQYPADMFLSIIATNTVICNIKIW